jgi:hypothetical protein
VSRFWRETATRQVQEIDGKFVDLTPDDWREYDWHDVTCIEHPPDVQVYIRGLRKIRQPELPEAPR